MLSQQLKTKRKAEKEDGEEDKRHAWSKIKGLKEEYTGGVDGDGRG